MEVGFDFATNAKIALQEMKAYVQVPTLIGMTTISEDKEKLILKLQFVRLFLARSFGMLLIRHQLVQDVGGGVKCLHLALVGIYIAPGVLRAW